MVPQWKKGGQKLKIIPQKLLEFRGIPVEIPQEFPVPLVWRSPGSSGIQN